MLVGMSCQISAAAVHLKLQCLCLQQQTPSLLGSSRYRGILWNMKESLVMHMFLTVYMGMPLQRHPVKHGSPVMHVCVTVLMCMVICGVPLLPGLTVRFRAAGVS